MLERIAPRPRPYAGLVTRTVGFVIDAAVINTIAFLTVASINLVLSMFGKSIGDLNDTLTAFLGIAGWILLASAYFAASWTLTGQTLGMRLMGIRVERIRGGHISVLQGLRRLVGMVVSALLLFTGYLLILFDGRRRGLHDRFAGSVVVFMSPDEQPLPRPLARQLEREAGRLPR
jgi:uncharacterized RDD family membrane protein YckC